MPGESLLSNEAVSFFIQMVNSHHHCEIVIVYLQHFFFFQIFLENNLIPVVIFDVNV